MEKMEFLKVFLEFLLEKMESLFYSEFSGVFWSYFY